MRQVTISDEAFNFLQSQAMPLLDTASTVMDRLIAEYKVLKTKAQGQGQEGLVFDAFSAPSVKFTTITAASVNGKPASQAYWNNILEDVIACCASKGATTDAIISVMTANTKLGIYSDNGYRPVPSAGLSFQGLEANRALKNIAALAKAFEIVLEIHVRWQDNDDAALPNQSAKVVFP